MKPAPEPICSGYHLRPAAPLVWRKPASPAAAVTSVKRTPGAAASAGAEVDSTEHAAAPKPAASPSTSTTGT